MGAADYLELVELQPEHSSSVLLEKAGKKDKLAKATKSRRTLCLNKISRILVNTNWLNPHSNEALVFEYFKFHTVLLFHFLLSPSSKPSEGFT